MFASYLILLGFSNLSFGYKIDIQDKNVSETSLPPDAVRLTPIVQSSYSKTKEEMDSKISSNDIAQRLSRAHFEFTLKLYRALVTVSDPGHNMVFSPLLVSTLLTPLLLSARDFAEVLIPIQPLNVKDKYASTNGRNHSTTPVHRYDDLLTSLVFHINANKRVQRAYSISKQIQQALSFNNLTLRSIEAWHKATVATLQDKYYKKLLGAPRGLLFLRKNQDKRLQKILQKWFDTTVVKAELPMNATRIAEELNSWAKVNTKNQIEILVNESLLRRKLTLLLSPASLDSIWLYPFDVNRTYMKGLFYLSSKVRFEIPMMTSCYEIPLGYSPTMEARVIELPFQNRRASLFILLPDDLDQPLNILETNLTSDNVRALLSTLKDEIVNLRVPRFFVDSSPQMVEALKLLGVEDLFKETKVSIDSWSQDNYQSASDLHIHDFVHRVKFKMDEGHPNTESFNNVSSSKNPYEQERISAFGVKYFELDHPFVFFLWDYIASTIILMGRVVNPQPII